MQITTWEHLMTSPDSEYTLVPRIMETEEAHTEPDAFNLTPHILTGTGLRVIEDKVKDAPGAHIKILVIEECTLHILPVECSIHLASWSL